MSLKRKVARIAKIRNNKNIRESTFNIAGNSNLVVVINEDSPLKDLINLNTLLTLNTLNILAI